VKTFERLKAYSKSSIFRQSVHYIIAYRCQISEDDAEKFRKMFFKLDNHTNGFVTFENVKEYFYMYFKDE